MNRIIKIQDRVGEAYSFHCPGCEMLHMIPVRYVPQFAIANKKLKPTWRFNGNLEKPSFLPNFKIEWRGATPPQCCHCIIRDGELIFLVDSTHKLSGSRVKMAEID